MRRLLILFLAGAAALMASPCMADVWIYTFDSTPWTTPTPITNLPPDSGPAGFTTSFTASPLADSFEVNRWNGPSIVSGNSLIFNPKYITGTPAGNLTMTFSTNVSAVSLVIEYAGGISGVTVTNEQGDTQNFTPNGFDENSIPFIEMNFTPTNLFSTMTLAFTPNSDAITFFIVGNITITPPPPPPPPPAMQLSGGNLVLSWPPSFTLQSSPQLGGGFTDVTNAASPYTNNLSCPQMFFRLRRN